jgi:CRISPR-associated protein Cmr4
MTTNLIFVHVVSPLHAGTGQGVGAIDLPIAREKATNIPYLPGSSIKGVLRDLETDLEVQRAVFGPPTANASEHAGAAQFADARLLFMPVRSLAGTFAWVTSKLLLERYKRDANDVGLKLPENAIPDPQGQTCVLSQGSSVKVQTANASKVYVEDLDLNASETPDATAWAEHIASQLFTDANWQTEFKRRFCVVSGDVMSFLLETATEVVARIALEDDTKTVKDGQLWYEESLPAESILVSLVLASDSRYDKQVLKADKILEAIHTRAHDKLVQIGGKANVGRGLCRLALKGA